MNTNKKKRLSFTPEQNREILFRAEHELYFLVDEKSKIVTLKNGRKILVDNDFEVPSVSVKVRAGYIEVYARTCKDCIRKEVALARFIMQVTDQSLFADHNNRNTLDNRKSNIRVCTRGQNLANRVKFSDKKYKGVFQVRDKFVAEVQKEKIQYRTRTFSCEKEAAEIYDCLAIRLHGEFALTNFDKSIYTPGYIEIKLTNIHLNINNKQP